TSSTHHKATDRHDANGRIARPRSGRHLWDASVGGIRPAGIGDQRRPARPERVLIVRVGAEPQEGLVVASQALAIEWYAQPGSLRDRERAVAVLQLSTLHDVVQEVVVVRVCGEGEVR